MSGKGRISPSAYVSGFTADGWVRVGGIKGWESHKFEVKTEFIDGYPVLVGLRIHPRADVPAENTVIRRRRAESLPVGELARWGSFAQVDYIGDQPTEEELERHPQLRPVEGREFFATLNSDDSPDPLPDAPPRPRGGSDEFSIWVATVVREARRNGMSGWRAVVDAYPPIIDTLGPPAPDDHRHRKRAEHLIEEAMDHRHPDDPRGPCPPGCRRHRGQLERPRPRSIRSDADN
jgi:hypothetical protein